MSQATLKTIGANVERQAIVETPAPAKKRNTRKANYVWVSGLSFEVFHSEEEAKAKRREEGRGDVVKYSRWAGKTGIPACVIVSAVEKASIRASNLGTTPSYGDVCEIVQQGGSIDVIRRQINSAYAAYNRVAKSKGKAQFAGVPVLSQELGDFAAGMGDMDDDAFDSLNDELDAE